MDVLKSWVETFTTAGIRLVFFFDGVVKEQKREEWVRSTCFLFWHPYSLFCCGSYSVSYFWWSKFVLVYSYLVPPVYIVPDLSTGEEEAQSKWRCF